MTKPNTVDGRAADHSLALYRRAQSVIPGGVNSPVRAFRGVFADPPFITRAQGCRLFTEDGASVIDYVGSWGPAILGHAHPEVIEAVTRAAVDGLGFGAPTLGEVQMAELLCELVPSMRGGMVRLVSSGTEATMSAIRLARGYTGRAKIIKFDGGYHGHADMLLVAAGSGAATLGLPGSAGVPAGAVADTLIVPYNDLEAIGQVFADFGHDIAAIIVEPVAGNMGCIPPRPGYLEGLRDITRRHGALLIFDEVMTGFRVALGGAQERYSIAPDLTCLGKIVGGGMPVGAYGGRREILEKIAPLGPVYQAGTLSGNPLSVAAGLATLKILQRDNPYLLLEARTTRLTAGLRKAAQVHGLAYSDHQVASMFCGFFRAGDVWNYSDAKGSNTQIFGCFHREMLARGIYLAPSQFEAGFMSLAHDDAAIETTLAAANEAMAIAAATRTG